MQRTHCIPGATLLFIAFLLSLLVCPSSVRSITPKLTFSRLRNQTALSLPYVRDFDFVRVTFQGNPASANTNEAASQVRVSALLRLPRRIDTNVILLVHVARYLGLLLPSCKKWRVGLP